MARILLIIGFLAVVAFFVWSGWPKTKEGRIDDAAITEVVGLSWFGTEERLNGRAISKTEYKRSGA